jgi:arsenate reductase
MPGKRVLFVCVGNACRSPMAEGYAKYFAKTMKKELHAESRGVDAASHVTQTSVEAMREEGIDISSHVPRQFEDRDIDRFDVIVTMGPEVVFLNPILNEKKVMHWDIPDPVEQGSEVYRGVRDLIKRKTMELVKSL